MRWRERCHKRQDKLAVCWKTFREIKDRNTDNFPCLFVHSFKALVSHGLIDAVHCFAYANLEEVALPIVPEMQLVVSHMRSCVV